MNDLSRGTNAANPADEAADPASRLLALIKTALNRLQDCLSVCLSVCPDAGHKAWGAWHRIDDSGDRALLGFNAAAPGKNGQRG